MLKVYGKCALHRKRLLKIKHIAKLCCYTQREELKVDELEPAYHPGVEGLYDGQGYFESKTTSDMKFRLILPPPNITGTLHLGHALTATIQDVIVRTKRMQGMPTLWVPGIDHAGIATQVVVEKRLWKENHQTRHDVGREVFQQQVWKWKEEKAGVIGVQLRRLGVSLDWSREVFTLDPSQCRAVTAAFVKLFDQGLIYRSDQIVNWSCVLQSAISDIEVDHLEVDGPTAVPVPGYDKPVEFGRLTHFAYKFADSEAKMEAGEELVVATTRPETMLGDVAVAVNPKDDRYGRHIGRNLWHPFRKQTIPIICDDFVDPAFGTGAVKLTPAHDRIDFEAGKRHGLDVLSVIDEGGNLTDVCGEFSGVRRFDARDIVVSELERLGLLRGRQDHRMIVPICSRSKDVVEFLVRPQWFVKCKEMADRAADDVRQGRLVIEPNRFESTWFNWLENIRDWCVSRQLWWGHRIPAYICHTKDRPSERVWVAAETAEAAQAKAAAQLSTVSQNVAIQQDEDVLDTWFSSGLMPFSVFGWPQQNEDLSNYYPLSVMETGHDILFFWVARMVMLGNQLTGQLPFNKVLLHGMICDAQGRKMSKSLGNVVSPEDVISGSTLEELEDGLKASHRAGILSAEELKRAVQGQKKMFPAGIPECGSDALRFTLCSHNIKSHFINFDVQECHINKLFCNKIWQATKFTNIWMDKVGQSQDLRPIVGLDKLTAMDRWILSRLAALIRTCWESCEKHEFHVTTAALKQFLYYEFCDVYLEATKRGLRRTEESIAAGHCWTLTRSLGDALRLLAPFMPRLAQHLHRNLCTYPGETEMYDFPQICDELRDESLEKQVEDVMETVVAVRRMKKIFGVTAKHKPEAYIVVGGDRCSLYEGFRGAIEDLAACHKVNVCGSDPDRTLIKNAFADKLAGTGTVIYLTIPEELKQTVLELDMVNLEAKKSKLMKELAKMNKMISGDSYKTKATAEAQEAHSKKVATLQDKLTRINYIQSLAAVESRSCTT